MFSDTNGLMEILDGATLWLDSEAMSTGPLYVEGAKKPSYQAIHYTLCSVCSVAVFANRRPRARSEHSMHERFFIEVLGAAA